MVRYGGIQGFAGLFMIALVIAGFVQAGWSGVLTAILASWNAWPAIARWGARDSMEWPWMFEEDVRGSVRETPGRDWSGRGATA